MVVTAIVVAATASSVEKKWNGWMYVGGIIGSAVSAVVLVGFGIGNAWMLWRGVRRLRAAVGRAGAAEGDKGWEQRREGKQQNGNVMEIEMETEMDTETEMASMRADKEMHAGPAKEDVDVEKGTNTLQQQQQQQPLVPASSPPDNAPPDDLPIHGGGCLIFLFQRLFRLIDRPWKTYPLGILFGLGFDTSSEIALLALSSLQAAHGTSLWLILVFPVLFTIGMCLLDTADGALMMALYTKALRTGAGGERKDEIAPLYYNAVLTSTTVVVALVIGTFQTLALATAVLGDRATGGAWDGVNEVLDHWEAIGGGVCGLFVVAGVGSVFCYKPWRGWAVRRAGLRAGRRAGRIGRDGNVTETGDFDETRRDMKM